MEKLTLRQARKLLKKFIKKNTQYKWSDYKNKLALNDELFLKDAVKDVYVFKLPWSNITEKKLVPDKQWQETCWINEIYNYGLKEVINAKKYKK